MFTLIWYSFGYFGENFLFSWPISQRPYNVLGPKNIQFIKPLARSSGSVYCVVLAGIRSRTFLTQPQNHVFFFDGIVSFSQQLFVWRDSATSICPQLFEAATIGWQGSSISPSSANNCWILILQCTPAPPPAYKGRELSKRKKTISECKALNWARCSSPQFPTLTSLLFSSPLLSAS